MIEVADYTGFPEMLDGRVKPCTPRCTAASGSPRPATCQVMAEHGIGNIDLVVRQLYPFEATIANPDCTLEDAIENIDIGGPTMVRSAEPKLGARGHRHRQRDYAALSEELRNQRRQAVQGHPLCLAKKAFTHTAAYDGAISTT